MALIMAENGHDIGSAHGMRNEIAARRRDGVNRLHRQLCSYRFFAGDFVEIPLHRRKHECNEGRSRVVLQKLWEEHDGHEAALLAQLMPPRVAPRATSPTLLRAGSTGAARSGR